MAPIWGSPSICLGRLSFCQASILWAQNQQRVGLVVGSYTQGWQWYTSALVFSCRYVCYHWCDTGGWCPIYHSKIQIQWALLVGWQKHMNCILEIHMYSCITSLLLLTLQTSSTTSCIVSLITRQSCLVKSHVCWVGMEESSMSCIHYWLFQEWYSLII